MRDVTIVCLYIQGVSEIYDDCEWRVVCTKGNRYMKTWALE
jgi:hypothetical protein